MLKGQPDHANA